jgi:putative transposase
VLASIGSVGDAYDNALAESFVDSFKTELIRDRVWRTRSQLELAIVEYVAWFNNERLHTSLGGMPPAECDWRSERDSRVREPPDQFEKRKPTKPVSVEPGRAQ